MQITKNLLTLNPYSRPGTPLKTVTHIAIHYVGNPGSSAIANRNYFENLKTTKKTYASSHYIIGLNGEIIQCIPENEISYCTNAANAYSISIECCHPSANGKFTESTYFALIDLCADLCKRYKLNPLIQVIRHYDVTGKVCPKWFVEDVPAWEKFRQRVKDKISEGMRPYEITEAFVKKGYINSPDYWNLILEGRQAVNLSYLKILLQNVTRKTSPYDVVQALIARGYINSPDYWRLVLDGAQSANLGYLKMLMQNIAV